MFKIIRIQLFLLSILPMPLMAQRLQYVLTGKIGNLSPPAKAYFLHSTEEGNQLDSMELTNGRFSFSGVTKSPENLVYLKISQSGREFAKDVRYKSFYPDAKKISIISPDSLPNAKIIGGKLNHDQEALNILESTVASNSSDENDMSTEKKRAYIDFIRSHPNSIMSLKALRDISGNYPDPAEFELLFNFLSPEIRFSKGGIAYFERLAGIRRVGIGRDAPDFTMSDTTGKAVSLHQFKGKYVLLDFWASWCVPCRAESPYLVDSYTTYKDKNFTILSVSLDGPGSKSKWIKAIQDDNLTWTHVSDLEYNSKAAILYSINTIPQNFLIDPDGRIVAKSLRGAELKAKLKELLGEN